MWATRVCGPQGLELAEERVSESDHTYTLPSIPLPIRHCTPRTSAPGEAECWGLAGLVSGWAFQGQSLVQVYMGLFFGVRTTKYQGMLQTQVHADPIKTPFILNSMPGQSLG